MILLGLALNFAIENALASDSKNECVRDQAGLKRIMNGKDLHPRWIETTADDGKPLKINMEVRGDALYFIFDKTKEGIWAEGVVDVCTEKEGLSAEIAGKDIKVGDQAPRVIRWSMGGGATFHLKLKEAGHLHVSTFGWSGDFIPNDDGIPPAATPTASSASPTK